MKYTGTRPEAFRLSAPIRQTYSVVFKRLFVGSKTKILIYIYSFALFIVVNILFKADHS